MAKLHLFELKNGHVTLDGKIIRGIRECEFSIKENDSFMSILCQKQSKKVICLP